MNKSRDGAKIRGTQILLQPGVKCAKQSTIELHHKVTGEVEKAHRAQHDFQ